MDKLSCLAEDFPELNPNNCDDDDVRKVNTWGIEMVQLLAQLRGGGA